MNCEKQANAYLADKKYQELVNYLEEKIDCEPDKFDYYCYLGLAYFLLGREEEAQTAWFFIFSQEDEEYLEYLVTILEQEAEKQFETQKYETSYSLRQVIREIYPESVNNLFLMAELAIKLNLLSSDYLKALSIVEALKNANQKEIDLEILHRVFAQLLENPLLMNIPLTEAILDNQHGENKIINLILAKARLMRYKNFPNYSADLGFTCLKYFPNHLGVLREVFWHCMSANYFEKSKMIGDSFLENVISFEGKVYGYYLLVYWAMKTSHWDDATTLVKEHRSLLLELADLANQNNYTVEVYFRNALVYLNQYVLYFYDTPKQTRQIINKLAYLYQNLYQQEYSCVSFSYEQYDDLKTKKLNIAYIGNAFRANCPGFLSRSCISNIDQNKFNLHIYALTQKQDEITEKYFKTNITKFANMPKDAVIIAKEIQRDKIDILVDLDCLTGDLTQAVMALKPAPIQVSWLGLDATGIPAVDYFLVDSYVVPDNAQEYYQESLWRLPHSYLAVDGFEVGISPLTRQDLDIPNNAIVYLSLQSGFKRHPDNVRLQMKILREVPNSYFLISAGINDLMKKNIRNLFTKIAIEEGVNPDRIKVLPYLQDLGIYRASIILGDIVLDTYPFNGATTTLEALWLNIPLVTRVGEQFHARQGYSFLSNLGISEGIAWSDKEYIKWGIELGTNEELRKQVSWKLQQSKKTSPLWNGKQLAREMEKAYQQMWNIYVDRQLN